MNNNETKKTILYGVPKVGYGIYGCTPFPICLKACANYLGIDIAYEDALVISGAAFRMNWNEQEWDGGNVDAMLTYDSTEKLFVNGFGALGLEMEFLSRDKKTTKEQFFNFIKEQIDKGLPCIALGIIGPPEACIVTGYDEDGQRLYGWNFFQDYPDCAAGVTKDENGYFITDCWWKNAETIGVFGLDKKSSKKLSFADIIDNAVEVMSPRHFNNYAKGLAGINAWRDSMASDSEFEGKIMTLISERLMCHGDALDCLSDGRGHACLYFKKKAEEMPELNKELMEIADAFEETKKISMKMFDIIGGFERGVEQVKKLADKAVREKSVQYIDKISVYEGKALLLLKELQKKLD